MTQPILSTSHPRRHRTGGRIVHPLEAGLLCVVATELALLPWSWGGMKPWSHILSLVLSASAALLALWPRTYEDRSEGKPPFRLFTWPKLLKFPVFWLGLALLLYVTVQALNHAWIFETDGQVWWLKAVAGHPRWLPSGVRVPFDHWGPWRLLIIYASTLITVWAIWIGFTRRWTYQALFTVLATNGFLLATVAIAQRLAGNGKVLWLFEPSTSYFVAAIPYKNHAGAYFNILLALTFGLGFWYYLRSTRRHDKSSPAIMFLFFCSAIALAIVFSFSRASVMLMVGLIGLYATLHAVHLIRSSSGLRGCLVPVVLLTMLGGFLWLGLYSMRIEDVTKRFDKLLKDDRGWSIERRNLAAQATWDMARSRIVFGWGAGCFRSGFPLYQLKYDRISFDELHRRIYYEHAHNDFLETLAELGTVGSAILLMMFAYGVRRLIQARFWTNPMVVLTSAGILTTILHAWIDFPFQNPAILTTWAVVFFSSIRWLELDESN